MKNKGHLLIHSRFSHSLSVIDKYLLVTGGIGGSEHLRSCQVLSDTAIYQNEYP